MKILLWTGIGYLAITAILTAILLLASGQATGQNIDLEAIVVAFLLSLKWPKALWMFLTGF